MKTIKNLILILIFFFANLIASKSFAQKTELYINFEELMEPEKVYTVYFSVNLYKMSILYKYEIKEDETINGIVYLDGWERFPYYNFFSKHIKIYYTIEDEFNWVEGEIHKKIKLGKKNFFKFKKSIFGLRIKKCNGF
jgi:hypothetical protein